MNNRLYRRASDLTATPPQTVGGGGGGGGAYNTFFDCNAAPILDGASLATCVDLSAGLASVGVPVTVVDSSTIDLTSSGALNHTITAAVRVSGAVGNSLSINADGLFVGAGAETPFVANDSQTLAFTTSGSFGHTLTGAVKVSSIAGNSITVQPDGLFAAQDTALVATNSQTITFATSGTSNHTLTGSVNISTAPGNDLTSNATGLFVDVSAFESTLVATDSATVDFTTSGPNGHSLSAAVKLSANAGNDLSAQADGLFVDVAAAETPVTVVDTPTVDLTAGGTNGHTLQASVKLSANAGNAITAQVDGLFAPTPAAAAFGVAANTGTPETLLSGDTLNLLGTFPIRTVVQATDTVRFDIDTSGATAGQALVFDGTNVIWQFVSGGSFTANNGVSINPPGNVQLGGTLIQSTLINADTFPLVVSNTSGDSVVFNDPAFNFMQVIGTFGTTVEVVNTSGAFPANGFSLMVDASAGPVTITLPIPLSNARHIVVKKIDTTSNDVTLTGSIDNQPTYTLAVPMQAVHLTSTAAPNPATWWVI